jgi:hypothetical protein
MFELIKNDFEIKKIDLVPKKSNAETKDLNNIHKNICSHLCEGKYGFTIRAQHYVKWSRLGGVLEEDEESILKVYGPFFIWSHIVWWNRSTFFLNALPDELFFCKFCFKMHFWRTKLHDRTHSYSWFAIIPKYLLWLWAFTSSKHVNFLIKI